MTNLTGGVAAHRSIPVVLIALAIMVPLPAGAQPVPEIFLYVNDLTSPRSLLQDESDNLQALCYEVDDLSSAEIAILIVNSTDPLDIDSYAVEVFERNAIGKEGRDNGLLIMVSLDLRLWRIEVGYGLEGILPDAFVGRVGTDILAPALAAGDLYGGLYDTAFEIGSHIVENYDSGTPNPYPDPLLWVLDWRSIAIVTAVVVGVGILTRGRVFLWVGSLFNLFRRGGFGGGRSGGGGARGKF